MKVGAARKASGIKYPQCMLLLGFRLVLFFLNPGFFIVYAEKAEAAASPAAAKFNCVQREIEIDATLSPN